MKGYYFVTDSSLSRRGNISDVRKAVSAGACAVQYRDKSEAASSLYKQALALRKICKGVPFIINDRVDLCLAVAADGVHLGQDDMPCKMARRILGKNKIIGVTVHNIEQAIEAKRSGADYLAVSPVFQTMTKKDAGRPVGLSLIKKIKRKLRIPVVAIGGINLKNADSVIRAGADAICAISAVVTGFDAAREINKFNQLFL